MGHRTGSRNPRDPELLYHCATGAVRPRPGRYWAVSLYRIMCFFSFLEGSRSAETERRRVTRTQESTQPFVLIAAYCVGHYSAERAAAQQGIEHLHTARHAHGTQDTEHMPYHKDTTTHDSGTPPDRVSESGTRMSRRIAERTAAQRSRAACWLRYPVLRSPKQHRATPNPAYACTHVPKPIPHVATGRGSPAAQHVAQQP